MDPPACGSWCVASRQVAPAGHQQGQAQRWARPEPPEKVGEGGGVDPGERKACGWGGAAEGSGRCHRPSRTLLPFILRGKPGAQVPRSPRRA